MEKQRLDKVIASTGKFSRREVKALVRQGRVLVDGIPARSAEDKVDAEAVEIMVNGECLMYRRYTWVMLNKPAGYLSATEDGRGPTVLDLLPQELRALHGAAGLPSGDEDVISLVCQQAGNPQRPRLIQLCGTSDFLYEDNQTFRRAAEKAGYGHTYLEAPGDHEWPYWDKAIQYAFQFFRNMDMKTTPIY